MLYLCCILTCGNYFCYDCPAALQTQLEDDLGISTTKYALLYSAYAIPNMFMPFFGGILVDRIGKNRTLLIFASFLTLG